MKMMGGTPPVDICLGLLMEDQKRITLNIVVIVVVN